MPRPVQPLGTFGTITVTKVRTGVYLAVTRYRDFDGGYRHVKKTAPTAKQAENALKLAVAEIGDQYHDGDLTRRSSLREAAEIWRAEERAAGRVAPQTMDRYERDLDAIVLPALGNLRLGEITVGTADRFLKAVARKKPGSVRATKVVLSHVLGLATRHDAIPTNPVRQVGHLPRREKREVRIATPGELAVMRTAIATWRQGEDIHGPKPDGQLGKVFDLMLGTATRVGEVLAIRRRDIDLRVSPATLTISGTIVYVRGRGYIRQDHPKHSKHWRMVALPLFAENALRLRLAELGGSSGDQPIFCTRNGTPITPANLRRQWRAVRDAFTELPDDVDLDSITPHVFRKTGATTITLSAGIELAAQLLGHSSTAITEEFYVRPAKLIDSATAAILEQLGPQTALKALR